MGRHGRSLMTCVMSASDSVLTFFSFQRQRGADPELRALRAAPASARPQRLAVHGRGGRGEEPRH